MAMPPGGHRLPRARNRRTALSGVRREQLGRNLAPRVRSTARYDPSGRRPGGVGLSARRPHRVQRRDGSDVRPAAGRRIWSAPHLDSMLPSSDATARAYIASVIEAGYRVSDVESTERDATGGIKYFANSMTGVSRERPACSGCGEPSATSPSRSESSRPCASAKRASGHGRRRAGHDLDERSRQGTHVVQRPMAPVRRPAGDRELGTGWVAERPS